MSVGKAFQAWSALDAEQRRFIGHPVLEGDYAPAQLRDFFAGIAEFDRHADKLRQLCGGIFIGGLVLALIGGLGGSIVSDLVGRGAGMALFVLAGILAVTAVVFFVFWLVLRSKDVPNTCRDFVHPVLTLLGEDVAPDQSLHLQLDLSNSCDKTKLAPEQPENRKKKGYPKVHTTVYLNDWLHLEAPLADKSRLEIDIVDRVRKVRKTKRSASGKIKTKTKYKVKCLLEANLGARTDEYRAETGGSTRGRKVRVKSGDKRSTVRVRQSCKGDGKRYPLEPDQLLDLVGAAYAKLRAAPTAAGRS